MFWIISFLPSELLSAISLALLVLGVVLTAVASVVRFVPVINMYRLYFQIAGVVILLSGVYLRGVFETEIVWRQRVAEAEAKIRAAEKRAEEATAQVVVEYRDRVQVVKQRVQVVKKEIEVQREVINADCKLNPTAVELYNRSIAAPVEKKP
jgi:hypothetical protein